MRITIKGGLWKNTEDEVLKAAVMKYGQNQWARISSLLVRKSARQCKARWNEWLHPSIKKTEWTRLEQEKLLHLAKLMPSQWRTIAPIVGRTPSQCLHLYEKLLDTTADNLYDPLDDPRLLRPGEMDPNPESKPARPDPVDMDDDEKEMLSEARARLANTRGKKAKRKARESQLEEARRLASLQKRRELTAAGIDNRSQRKRKTRGIDYNAEIPFQKIPPPGFFDVADEEDRPAERPKFPTTVEQLEGKRRVDVEAQLRRLDAARAKIRESHDAPSAILINDPEKNVCKRPKLMLPPPQITDHELAEIAKMGYASSDLLATAGENGATCALLAHTPHPIPTPLSTPGAMGTTLSAATPIRDELHINKVMDVVHDGNKFEVRRQAELRTSLKSALTSLPQPKNEYQILVQPLPEENEQVNEEDKIEQDMSDKVAREKTEEEARQQALLEKRSKVLQRELPRPPCASVELIRSLLTKSGEDKSCFVPPTPIERADEMLQKELLSLLEHDNAKYPLDDKKGTKCCTNRKSPTSVPETEEFEGNALQEAGLLINEEIKYLHAEMGHENESIDEFVKAHDACQEDVMYFPTRNANGLSSVAGNMDKLAAFQNGFENVKSWMDDHVKKGKRLEQKIEVLTRGYQTRACKLCSQIEAIFKETDIAAIELECFQALQIQEHQAALHRIQGLQYEVEKQKALEEILQKCYGHLRAEQERIHMHMQQEAHGRLFC